MSAQRITYAELETKAWEAKRLIEFNNAAGTAHLIVGRKEYVATVPPPVKATAPDGAA